MSLADARNLIERAKAGMQAEDWESAAIDLLVTSAYVASALDLLGADDGLDQLFEISAVGDRVEVLAKEIKGKIDLDENLALVCLSDLIDQDMNDDESGQLAESAQAFRKGYNDGRYCLFTPPKDHFEIYLVGHGHGCKRREE